MDTDYIINKLKKFNQKLDNNKIKNSLKLNSIKNILDNDHTRKKLQKRINNNFNIENFYNKISYILHGGMDLPENPPENRDDMDRFKITPDFIRTHDTYDEIPEGRIDIVLEGDKNIHCVRNVHDENQLEGATNDVCGICFDNMLQYEIICVLKPCNHIYHYYCIRDWLSFLFETPSRPYPKCPKCSKEINCISVFHENGYYKIILKSEILANRIPIINDIESYQKNKDLVRIAMNNAIRIRPENERRTQYMKTINEEKQQEFKEFEKWLKKRMPTVELRKLSDLGRAPIPVAQDATFDKSEEGRKLPEAPQSHAERKYGYPVTVPPALGSSSYRAAPIQRYFSSPVQTSTKFDVVEAIRQFRQGNSSLPARQPPFGRGTANQSLDQGYSPIPIPRPSFGRGAANQSSMQGYPSLPVRPPSLGSGRAL